MNRVDVVKVAALAEVGSPYVYGGTGQPCTPAYRRGQMKQYPEHADNITKNCPVLSGKQSSCAGCKYQGRKAYDCAQWNRRMLEKVGVMLPSGATNQWKADVWTKRGTIDTLPLGVMCCVYKGNGESMSHTGLYMGDGTVTDARSHSKGVRHDTLEEYGQWTHWAMPKGLHGSTGDDFLFLAEVICSGWLNIRDMPESSEYVGKAYPGTLVEVLDDARSDWWQIRTANVTGWVPTSKNGKPYLKRYDYVSTPEDEEAQPEETITVEDQTLYKARVTAEPTLNIRTSANVRSTLLTRANKGDVLDVLNDQSDEWWLVRYNGVEGYAMTGKDEKTYLERIVENEEEVPVCYSVTLDNVTPEQLQEILRKFPDAQYVACFG